MRHNVDKLKVGGFYWVIPVYDVDLIPPGFEGVFEFTDALYEVQKEHWSQKTQPARFDGWDEGDEERWSFIGQDDPSSGESWWPVRWVGSELTPP